MTKARLDLSGFDEPAPNKDPAVLRQISDGAGFPSRQAAPPIVPPVAAPPAAAPAPAAATTAAFQRPARPSGNRQVAMNVRVDPETAERMYALRDADSSSKRALADVVEEAIALLYAKHFPAP